MEFERQILNQQAQSGGWGSFNGMPVLAESVFGWREELPRLGGMLRLRLRLRAMAMARVRLRLRSSGDVAIGTEC